MYLILFNIVIILYRNEWKVILLSLNLGINYLEIFDKNGIFNLNLYKLKINNNIKYLNKIIKNKNNSNKIYKYINQNINNNNNKGNNKNNKNNDNNMDEMEGHIMKTKK